MRCTSVCVCVGIGWVGPGSVRTQVLAGVCVWKEQESGGQDHQNRQINVDRSNRRVLIETPSPMNSAVLAGGLDGCRWVLDVSLRCLLCLGQDGCVDV